MKPTTPYHGMTITSVEELEGEYAAGKLSSWDPAAYTRPVAKIRELGQVEFIFIIDEDEETGGEKTWKDGTLTSYAWVSPKEHFDRTFFLQDNIRTKHVTQHYPNFLGVDDMESHFEFNMNKDAVHRHLISLGFTEKKGWGKPS